MTPQQPWTKTCLAATLVATLAACGSDGGSDNKPTPPKPDYAAELRRTEFGVPHILAQDEKGLGFGVGYAFAQDNFCMMADLLVTLSGERSKHFGPKAGYDDGMGQQIDNLASDVIHKLLGEEATLQSSWEQHSAEAKDLLRGYAAGYNRYLKDTGTAHLPQACRAQSWVREMAPFDLLRLHRVLAIEPSQVTQIGLALTPAAAAPAAARLQRLRSALQAHKAQQARLRMGSNGVALGKDASESGAGLLLANPHFPWNGPARFYQLHLTIPGKVDVMGASLSGFPAVHIGFNKDLAWTHTVTQSQHGSIYQLTLDPSDPGRYMVDGQSRAFSLKSIEVDTLEAGLPGKFKKTVQLSDFGLVLAAANGVAYALRDANFENNRMLDQWWAMNKAANLEAFKTSIETIVGIPWAQAIATEKGGRVYYANITPVPALSDASHQNCLLKATEDSPTTDLLDGSRSACAWAVDAGAKQKGILPAAQLPSLLRTDFVQNSNDSAWMSNPAQPLLGFPALVSVDGQPLSERTRYGLQQITARLNGGDGKPGKRFTMKQLQDMLMSQQSQAATHLLPDLLQACAGASSITLPDEGGMVDIRKGCQLLAAWDGRAASDSVGWLLFETWLHLLNESQLDFWRLPFDRQDPLHTPSGLRLSDAAVQQGARQALGAAMLYLDAQGMDYSKPWGQIQVAVRGDKRIPIGGGNLFGDDIYNSMMGRPSLSHPGQLETYYGSSIVLTVSFEGASPKAQGFLSYSQSSNPDSPHYADQTERFSANAWISYPFTEAEIKADPKYSSQTLKQ